MYAHILPCHCIFLFQSRTSYVNLLLCSRQQKKNLIHDNSQEGRVGERVSLAITRCTKEGSGSEREND